MFISHLDFEQAVPRSLLPKGGRAWSAVELSLLAPFFALTLVFKSERHRTFLVSSNNDVAGLIEANPDARVKALTRIALQGGPSSNWQATTILRAWKVSDHDEGSSWSVVFSDGDTEFTDPFTMNIANDVRRELMFDLV